MEYKLVKIQSEVSIQLVQELFDAAWLMTTNGFNFFQIPLEKYNEGTLKEFKEKTNREISELQLISSKK